MNISKISYKKFLQENNYIDDFDKYNKVLNLNIIEHSLPVIDNKNNDYIEKQYTFIKDYIKNNFNEKINEWAISYYNKNPLQTYSNLFYHFIVNKILNFEDSVGLDFGCGFGFSTLNYATFKPKKIYCCDVRDKWSSQKFLDDSKNQLNLSTTMEYILNKNDNFLDNSITNLNWIIIYDVLTCIQNYDDNNINILMFKYLKKSFDILNNNGLLFIADWTKNMQTYNPVINKQIKDSMMKIEEEFKTKDSFDKIGYPNFNDLQSSQEICKMLEIIGFNNIELYHSGYNVNSRFYITCTK